MYIQRAIEAISTFEPESAGEETARPKLLVIMQPQQSADTYSRGTPHQAYGARFGTIHPHQKHFLSPTSENQYREDITPAFIMYSLASNSIHDRICIVNSPFPNPSLYSKYVNNTLPSA
jgi:hypothetical protein